MWPHFKDYDLERFHARLSADRPRLFSQNIVRLDLMTMANHSGAQATAEYGQNYRRKAYDMITSAIDFDLKFQVDQFERCGLRSLAEQ